MDSSWAHHHLMCIRILKMQCDVMCAVDFGQCGDDDDDGCIPAIKSHHECTMSV